MGGDSGKKGPSVTAATVGDVELVVVDVPLAPSLPDELTSAEREIAGLLMAGKSNAEIASARSTSLRTVANQLAAMYRKLGVASRAELVAALTNGS